MNCVDDAGKSAAEIMQENLPVCNGIWWRNNFSHLHTAVTKNGLSKMVPARMLPVALATKNAQESAIAARCPLCGRYFQIFPPRTLSRRFYAENTRESRANSLKRSIPNVSDLQVLNRQHMGT